MSLVLTLALGLAAAPPPEIELYTFGPGDDLFSKFGHSAICVDDQESPRGRCFNYGTADFSTPVPLTWDFIRGRARFWVSVARKDRMLDYYRRSDRSIWVQRLELNPARAQKLVRELELSTREDRKYYRYHHFLDNCTTRIRDLVNKALDGRLKTKTSTPADGPSYRQWAKRGFRSSSLLLVVTDLVLGRAADTHTSPWMAAFLPRIFMKEVESQLGAKPQLVYKRHAAPDQAAPSAPWVFIGLGLLGAALLFLTRRHRAGVFVVFGFLGAIGLLLWGLAALSDFEELRWNEALLVFLPLDLAVPFLSGPWRKKYATFRGAGLAAVCVAWALGLLVQPLLPMLVGVGSALLAFASFFQPRTGV